MCRPMRHTRMRRQWKCDTGDVWYRLWLNIFMTTSFDLMQAIYALVVRFNLAEHVGRMAQKHPNWTVRQKRNPLCWQNSARKMLREEIQRHHETLDGLWCTMCPEAMGVDVSGTLQDAEIALEWPPENAVCKVAFAGTLHSTEHADVLLSGLGTGNWREKGLPQNRSVSWNARRCVERETILRPPGLTP